MAITQPLARRDVRRPNVWWTRLHFLVRFLGLTGALVAFVGLVLIEPQTWQDCVGALNSPPGSRTHIGGWLLAGGAAVVILELLLELVVILRVAAGRRSAFGFNALLQVALAAVLVVGVNAWSFRHSLRFDWTRGQHFTLPADLRERLSNLDPKSETTVVVYQQHKTFGALSDKPDRFDYAAERKVVEKVKDLVGLLREVGPQLRVEVLDVEEEGYDDKLKTLTENAPALRKAIESAPENSIFISNRAVGPPSRGGPEYVQQLSFNELYQLDKVQSKDDNGGRGNLVLLGQGEDGRGVRPFVHKILNLEQRRPRVGVLTIHQLLSTRGAEPSLTQGGLRKALAMHGFDVKDVILKKWEGGGFPKAAADTFEESRLAQLELQLKRLDLQIARLEREVKETALVIDDLTPKPGEDVARRLSELSEKYRGQLSGRKLTAELRDDVLAVEQRDLELADRELAKAKKEREGKRGEHDQLDVDRISEARRMTDVKAKLGYALADCDLLIIPRMTRQTEEARILPRLYRLEEEQVDAVRNFLTAGKPVLACFGPLNESPNTASRLPPTAPPAGPDALELLLADLGIRMGRQTILTDADSKGFTEGGNPFLAPEAVEVPPLDFDSPVDAASRPWQAKGSPLPPNPLRNSLRVTAHSAAAAFDIRLRFPRPIYYEPREGKKPASDATFLLSPTGWNEEQPFATDEAVPQFTRPKSTDPNNGTVDARRRGQFPIGVAIETALPKSWGKDAKDKTVRVAAIGQGGVFVGADLKPPQERLLLQTVNWLLGRDDYLPQADHPWSYPRLPLTPEEPEHRLWLWGARLGLPVLFAYLGFVVLLFRRLR